MKKLFAILAVMGVLTLGSVQPVMAQDAAPAQTEQTTEAAVVEEGGGLHKELKTKFIEGDASFMSLVAIALVLGLAFCIERIIYLSLAETNTKKLMANYVGDIFGAPLAMEALMAFFLESTFVGLFFFVQSRNLLHTTELA